MRFFSRSVILFLVLPFAAGRAQVPAGGVLEAYNAAVSGSKQFVDPGAWRANPASLSGMKAFTAAACMEKRYGLRELSTGSAIVVIPAYGGALGAGARYSGFPEFSTSLLQVGYGRALGPVVRLGTAINYTMLHAAGYGNDAAIGFELATIMQATRELSVSLCVANPVGGKFLHNPSERLGILLSTALTWEPSGQLVLQVTTVKKAGVGVDICPSVHYAFAQDFFVRAGLSTLSGSFMAGCGLGRNGWRLDFMAGFQGQLGVTPGFQIVTGLQKKPS